jgi:hypothetical protein
MMASLACSANTTNNRSKKKHHALKWGRLHSRLHLINGTQALTARFSKSDKTGGSI